MAINDGDFVRVNFTGKVKETDDVFDTTAHDAVARAGPGAGGAAGVGEVNAVDRKSVV